MALINALMAFKNKGYVRNFKMLGQQKATVRLQNGMTLVVFMAADYIVGKTAVEEAISAEPRPDYILYDEWGKVTEAARAAAKKVHLPIVRFGHFGHILEELVARPE